MKVPAGAAVLFSLAVLTGPACHAESLEATQTGGVEESLPRAGRVQIWLNPFSAFTTGPSAGLSVMLGDKIALGALLRARGLGLVTSLVTLYENYNYSGSLAQFQLQPYSADISLEISYLFSSPRRETMIRVGIETGIGLAWTQTLYQMREQFNSYASYSGFGMFLAQGAFRWRYPSGFFLEVGGRLGIQMLMWEASWFPDSPHTIYRSIEPELYPTGSLDLTIGFELARR